MNKLKKIVNDETGGALVLVMMVLVVLSALGASVAATTMQSNQNSHRIQDHNSAYYIAEAGANLAYEDIQSQIMETYDGEETPETFFNKIPTLASTTYNDFTMETGNPVANVQVTFAGEDTDSKTFKIMSTGKVGQNSRTVEKEFVVKYVKKDEGTQFPEPPENAAVIVKSKLNFTGGTLNGDIYIDSSDEGTIKLGDWGTINANSINTGYTGDKSKVYADVPSWMGISHLTNITVENPMNPPWEKFKEMLNLIKLPTSVTNTEQSLILTGGKKSTISKSTEYTDKLSITGGSQLIVDTNAGNINLVMDSLTVSGDSHIEIIGDGILNIYVKNNFDINGGSSINAKMSRSQLKVYYFGEDELYLHGSELLNGNLLVEKANIDLSASGSITGAILTGGRNVNVSGGSSNNTIIIAPADNSTINLSNGSITGVVMADTLNMSNGTLTYQWFDPEILFPGSDGSAESVDVSNLIPSVGPALEP